MQVIRVSTVRAVLTAGAWAGRGARQPGARYTVVSYTGVK